MPYTNFTKKKGGKTVFCMTSKDTNKTYCYKSKEDRTKGAQQHEMFKSMKERGELK